MLKIILALVLAILLIVCIVKFEIALFKFLTVVFLVHWFDISRRFHYLDPTNISCVFQ